MRIVKKIVLGLILILGVLLAIGMFLPKVYKVERSLVINAPAELIFDQVNDLKKNEEWSPWKDPTMQITYGPISAGKGATSTWTSKDMGNGSQTITESEPDSAIKLHLDFGSHGTAEAYWSFVPEGEGVRVTQGMTGDQGMNPAKRWAGFMMDKMIGKYFEQGLASLKQVSEARAAETKAAPAAQAAVPADSAAAPAAAPAHVPSGELERAAAAAKATADTLKPKSK